MNRKAPNNASFDSWIRTIQHIAGAMMLGLIAFCFIASITGGKVKSETPILAYLAVAFAAQVTALRLFIPALFVKSQLETLKDEGTGSIAERLQSLFQARMIIAMALLMGAALFNLFAYVINGQWFSMATAGFMLVLMGTMFPTVRKFERWVEEIERNMN
jgi:hypothetical protein